MSQSDCEPPPDFTLANPPRHAGVIPIYHHDLKEIINAVPHLLKPDEAGPAFYLCPEDPDA